MRRPLGAVKTPTPPFVYYGGKQRVASRIVALMPAHTSYVEPYCGGLAVLLTKPRSLLETVNDLDGHLMNLWEVIRDQADEFARVCALTPHSRAEYLRCAEITTEMDPVERARRTWIRFVLGRSGGTGKKGWRFYSDPDGTNTGMPGYLRGYVARIHPAMERLQNVSLECRPALDVIHEYGRSPNSLLYVDPPYLGATRNSMGYRFEMPTEDEHRGLAKALHSVQGTVLLSGYSSPLYSEMYADWPTYTMRSTTGARSRRTEVVWSNRPLDGFLL